MKLIRESYIKHRLRERPLQGNLIVPLVTMVEIMVDLSELSVDMERFEVQELILNVSQCEECLDFVPHYVCQASFGIEWILVGER